MGIIGREAAQWSGLEHTRGVRQTGVRILALPLNFLYSQVSSPHVIQWVVRLPNVERQTAPVLASLTSSSNKSSVLRLGWDLFPSARQGFYSPWANFTSWIFVHCEALLKLLPFSMSAVPRLKEKVNFSKSQGFLFTAKAKHAHFQDALSEPSQ